LTRRGFRRRLTSARFSSFSRFRTSTAFETRGRAGARQTVQSGVIRTDVLQNGRDAGPVWRLCRFCNTSAKPAKRP
jgi:hypothetical protein